MPGRMLRVTSDMYDVGCLRNETCTATTMGHDRHGVHVLVCLCACALVCFVCASCGCVRVCLCTCVRVRVCLVCFACVLACVRACARACIDARVHACTDQAPVANFIRAVNEMNGGKGLGLTGGKLYLAATQHFSYYTSPY